jgi:hypothetical protein
MALFTSSMWKFLTFIGSVLKTLFWLALVLALAGFVALYVLERDMPQPLVSRIAEACSTDDILCRIGRATFSLRSGLHLHQVKAFPKRIADSALVSVDEITVSIALQPRLNRYERLRGITLKNISFPTLPKKPPKPDTPAEPLPAVCEPAQPSPTPLLLPSVPPFPLVIEKANILGLLAERITATVALSGTRIVVTQATVAWPDKTFAMKIDGGVTADFDTRIVSGTAKGQTFPENILPLLSALRARGAIKQIDCFSKLERPVGADAAFDVNMDNSDFVLRLALDVGPCAYRQVPMKFARGSVCAYGTNIYTTVAVGPLQAESATGPLSGRLVYREDTEGIEFDTTSAMDLQQMVTVINILNNGELKPVRCFTPPRVTAKGVMAVDSKKSTVTNSLLGKIAFDEGSIFNLHVKNVTSDLKVQGYSALFDNVIGTCDSGGTLAGNLIFTFPNYAATSTVFTTRATLKDIDLSDLSRVFNITNERVGLVSGNMLLHGRTNHRTVASLAGEGKLNIREGTLHRMPLFAGFTDYLARNIPGVSALVNQSSGSMDFTIRDGILRTENLLVEGDLFSITGRGSYNLDTDSLDFVMRANIFRQKTIAGRITHLVTLPFTRLLLEFKVFGTIDNPEWSYASIIERITDSLTDLSAQTKNTPALPEQPIPPPAPPVAP